ncbi:MAG: YetF domain-containing protein [Salinimicrobium sp.]
MDDTVFLWNGAEPIARILFVGTAAYVAIVLILRISGKRTLASMSAFDFVIAVAIGAVFGRTLTAKNLSLSESLTAFVLLAVLQFIFAYMENRSKNFKRLFNAKPTLLFYKGSFIEKNLHHERLDKSKIISAVRKKGFGDMDKVAAVILEIDATFSVLAESKEGEGATFEEVLKAEEDLKM